MSTAILWDAVRVEAIDDAVQRRTWFTHGAGAQQRIDDPLDTVEIPIELCSSVRTFAHVDPQTCTSRDDVIDAGVPLQGRRIGPEEQPYSDSAQIKMPSDDESVARVVALATTDRHRTAHATSAQHIHASASGILHQHNAWNTVLVDGSVVQFSHGFAVERQGSSVRFSVQCVQCSRCYECSVFSVQCSVFRVQCSFGVRHGFHVKHWGAGSSLLVAEEELQSWRFVTSW